MRRDAHRQIHQRATAADASQAGRRSVDRGIDTGISGKCSDAVQMEKSKATEEDDTLREMQRLREENIRLKKMYANLSMDHEIRKDGYEIIKKFAAQDAKKK